MTPGLTRANHVEASVDLRDHAVLCLRDVDVKEPPVVGSLRAGPESAVLQAVDAATKQLRRRLLVGGRRHLENG